MKHVGGGNLTNRLVVSTYQQGWFHIRLILMVNNSYYMVIIWLIIICLVVGIPTPLKNDGQLVSWDHYSIPHIWKNEKMFQTTNQKWMIFHINIDLG